MLFQPPTAAPAAPAAPSAAPAPETRDAQAADADADGEDDGGGRRTSRRRSTRKPSAEGGAAAGRHTGSGAADGADGGRNGGPAARAGAESGQDSETGQAGQAGRGPRGLAEQVPDDEADDDGADDGSPQNRRRRRRGGRNRNRGRGGNGPDAADSAEGDGEAAEDDESADAAAGKTRGDADADGEVGASDASDDQDDDEENGSGPGRRRRRKRRRGSAAETDRGGSEDDPPDTVVHVREPRPAAPRDDVRAVKGSTRLEAKRQRRREGRESGRRRPPVISEAEFLARREAVERTMVVRQRGDRTQIAVLEDGILVEHYVNRASHQSYVGNVYLGKVQNVLPSMEAAFVDIGKGRNAVLYAGEVNFDASGLEGQPKRIESALKSGQSILVQVTKDPVGHKGARLTSQVSLPGRYLVYVPGASMTGISRKLPDTERTRLKKILKKVMPEDAGVIVRTAAEGATEEELSRDVARLAAQWENIERKTRTASAAPELLYGEPDLTIRVVRDVFNEDFSQLIVAGDDGWAEVEEYVGYVAPHLSDRLKRWDGDGKDAFAEYRIDEQLAKALERKVWLPSGGSLVIDRTEAMTVIDVNTGKFTGQGGNLEETVTRNNLEAAEEIVRQLRLRDVGGIVVIDFIDMVLESNRELVLRRLLECLARDRTKHQVAEVTSLGLVQMTRKRVGAGLLEAFSVPCECCNGRGVHVSLDLADLGQPGHGCQQPGQGGGHSRGGRHENRHHDESSGRPGDDSAGSPGPSGPSGPGSSGSRRSRRGGDGRKGRNGSHAPADGHAGDGTAAAPAAAAPAATVPPAAEAATAADPGAAVDAAPGVDPAAVPAGGSQNGSVPHAGGAAPGGGPVHEAKVAQAGGGAGAGNGGQEAAASAHEAVPAYEPAPAAYEPAPAAEAVPGAGSAQTAAGPPVAEQTAPSQPVAGPPGTGQTGTGRPAAGPQLEPGPQPEPGPAPEPGPEA